LKYWYLRKDNKMAESTPPSAPKKKSNVTSTIDRMKANAEKKAAPGKQKIADAQAKYDSTAVTRGKNGRRAKDAAGRALNAEKAAQDKAMARTNDMMEGAQFGADVLGEDGLGRLSQDKEVTDALARKKEISEQGLSRQELAAERAQATRSIDSSTQTASRGLQAKLAKMGVKGSVAGQQLVQAEMQGAQQKADLSQNLFLKSEQIKREGLKDFSQRQGDIKTFDLGQSAKEKDIIMQSGLGFAQMGSAERTSEMQAKYSKEASIASARAGRSSSCFVGSTLLKDLDGKEIKFEDLQPGIMLKDNNLVMGVSKHLAVDDLYYFKGTKVTGCHFVFSNGNFVQVKNAVGAEKIEYDVDEVYVYNIITSSGVVEINNELFSDWNDDDLVEEHNAKVQGLHLREVQ
jgi:hypothetical protein